MTFSNEVIWHFRTKKWRFRTKWCDIFEWSNITFSNEVIWHFRTKWYDIIERNYMTFSNKLMWISNNIRNLNNFFLPGVRLPWQAFILKYFSTRIPGPLHKWKRTLSNTDLHFLYCTYNHIAIITIDIW